MSQADAMAIVSATPDASKVESRARDYIALLKPRVMSLVVFTGVAGLFLAPGTVHPLIAIVGILCIAIGSGAAGAINMWYEQDLDAVMLRTKNRPIPAGRVDSNSAIEFAAVAAVMSVFVMAVLVNYVAAFWLLAAILFYVFVYTVWLKRRTPQNIVIGGAAGAFPPVIGWAIVDPSLGIEPFVLFLIIFAWTPPHFWALSLYCNEDYKRANVPMLPVVSGPRRTRLEILVYSFILVATTLLLPALHLAGTIYFFMSIALGAKFLYHAVKLYKTADLDDARKLFRYSILYLFLLFVILMVDKGVDGAF